MEKIDLTKCHNCRFKAEISNSGPISGRIKVEESGVYLVDGQGNYIGFLSLDGEEIISVSGCSITDFEIVPRDPETYKDWQVGDMICITFCGNPVYFQVVFRSGKLVVLSSYNESDGIERISGSFTCEELLRDGYRLVLTDIEQQIIEEKKKYEPQDGDIVAWKNEEYGIKPAVSIYKEGNRGYATIFANGLTEYSIYNTFAMSIVRPATEDEKQQLFEAMANEGKRWNAEKKVVEDIPKPYGFKKGEPVLVRDDSDMIWELMAFMGIERGFYYPYRAENGHCQNKYRHCLPYNERTMHLLGTTEDYKEEQR